MNDWAFAICMMLYYIVIMHEFNQINNTLKQIKLNLENKS